MCPAVRTWRHRAAESQRRWAARHMNMMFALFLAVTASGATPGSTQVPLSQIPAYLRPPPRAYHIVAARSGNELAVSYALNVCYPAVAQLKAIAASFPVQWHGRT